MSGACSVNNVLKELMKRIIIVIQYVNKNIILFYSVHPIPAV